MNREESLLLSVCKYIAHAHPGTIFNTDLSGIRLPIALAKKAARLRSSRAFPDLVIYEARRGFASLFIELKAEGARIWLKDSTLSKDKHVREQARMLSALTMRGFCASFAVGFDEARKLIDWYLKFENLDEPFPLKNLT